MGKVKIFKEIYPSILEMDINSFFEKNKNVRINDIQYRMSHFIDNGQVFHYYSALIIYFEGEENE